MSLFSALGLKPISGSAPPTLPSVAITRAGPGRKGGKRTAPKSVVTEGEPIVVVVRPLGTVKWERHVAKMWGLCDPAGAIVRSGSTRQLKDMAAMNSLGDQAIQLLAGSATHETKWRADYAKVVKAHAASAVDIKKLEQALPKMRQRTKGDPDFFGDVNGYLVALENAENSVTPIRKAEKDLEQAASDLKTAVFQVQANEEEGKVADGEDKVAAKKAEIEEAKRVFGSVLDTAVMVVKQDWEGLALKAISFIGEQIIDDIYAADLQSLQQQLATAKSNLRSANTGAAESNLEAKRAGLESAALALEHANKLFRTALEQLARVQNNANNELKESGGTAIVGKMITERTRQMASIAGARAVCTSYVNASKAVIERITMISVEYGKVGSWLNDAEKADPVYARDTPYAQAINRAGLSNAIELGRWLDWGASIQRQCSDALRWLGDTGPKGPMGHFNRAIDLAKDGLKGAP